MTDYPSFVDERINDGEIVLNPVGGPRYSTEVNPGISGVEQRQVNWDSSLRRWDLGERSLRQSQLDTIHAFFLARMGRAIGFRFKDWGDYQVTPATGCVIAAASPVGAPLGSFTFSLLKRYTTAGGYTLQRPISKPVPDTFRLFTNGVPVAPADFTLNPNGTVTLLTSASLLAWSGEFDVPVRFDVDELKAQFIALDPKTKEALFKLSALPVVELRIL